MDSKDRERPENFEGGANGVLGAAAGLGAGGVLGAVMGAAVGGPVGMLIGGTAGTLLGAMAGYGIDFEAYEPEFRHHHEWFHPLSGHTFEQASPAYRYGWDGQARPEFHDHTYDTARPALHQGWTGSGDFVDYQDYVKHGWERRAAVRDVGASPNAAKR